MIVASSLMGLVYRAKSQPYEARMLLERALTIDPGYSQTQYNLALVLEDLGEEEKALFHYRKFLELAGDGNRRIVEKVRTHLRGLGAENR
jgi:tetratricopeptide (TPR) repeat protein